MQIKFVLPISLRGSVREFHVKRLARERYAIDKTLFSSHGNLLLADFASAQALAFKINQAREVAKYPELAVRAGDLYAAGLLDELLHLLVEAYKEQINKKVMAEALELAKVTFESEMDKTLTDFASDFPPATVYDGSQKLEDYLQSSEDGVSNKEIVLEELLMLYLANANPAMASFSELIDDSSLKASAYEKVIKLLKDFFAEQPPLISGEGSLFDMLRAPALASPGSLEGQIAYIRDKWSPALGIKFQALLARILTTLDILKEEQKMGFVGGGPPPTHVLDFVTMGTETLSRRERHEYERFSPDKAWMPRVVMLAKSTYVWLDQLSGQYKRDISKLDQIPDSELDELQRRGFTGLWLIGLWERSEASKRIKHLRGQPDAVASAYALYDYQIAHDLGGDSAYEDLRNRAWQRGIRLASDMVPNHVGIDGRWVVQHPEWFLQLDHSPYPGYSFNGPDLSSDERVGIFLEDHYYDSSDAAVVFKRLDRWTGENRYIYHGNDGTTMPWNDTAQINYLNPEAREAIIQTILHVARKFPIIRFDAAMTLAKQHIQRLWFPEPGHGGAIPSRTQYGSMVHEDFERAIPQEFWREVVDRVAEEVPDTLLLAEAFWMMEGYFVRTLGMHRVYNSAFMHMLKQEENAKYRQSIKNTLEFDPEILKRFVNFMNNPDEEPAIEQFGKDDKYFGVCLLMSTMPGLPMFGHGQVEGYYEKYGMEYRRAKWEEQADSWLIERHYREIFPLLHRRPEFAEVENFLLYDFYTSEGQVNEDVFAYSNNYNGKASLILYNNKFQTAKGWIKWSAAFKDKRDGHLKQREVAEGLGLKGGEKQFVILREQMSSLEYLKRSSQLQEQGFYTELEAFKYHAFVDIREVYDEDGKYEKLYDYLGQEGVDSVDEALQDLDFTEVFVALKAYLAADLDLNEVIKTPAIQVLKLSVDKAPGKVALNALNKKLESLKSPLSKDAEELSTLLQAHQPMVTILGLLNNLAPKEKLANAKALRLERFWQKNYGNEQSRLLSVVLSSSASSLKEQLREILQTSEGQRFIATNEHEGVLWFNQERFRLLATLLAADTYLREAKLKLEPLLKESLDLERVAEYRFDALLKALTASEKPEAKSLKSTTPKSKKVATVAKKAKAETKTVKTKTKARKKPKTNEN
ncbi:MAG: hypothetical protein KC422_05980 [Trueperaceae bacterium]|nr:hypothetical protein [Trueperaceae bacterium]